MGLVELSVSDLALLLVLQLVLVKERSVLDLVMSSTRIRYDHLIEFRYRFICD